MTIFTPGEPVTIDAALLAEARAAGLDVAAVCHVALLRAIEEAALATRRAIEEAALATRRADSAAAIAEWNDWAGSPPGG